LPNDYLELVLRSDVPVLARLRDAAAAEVAAGRQRAIAQIRTLDAGACEAG